MSRTKKAAIAQKKKANLKKAPMAQKNKANSKKAAKFTKYKKHKKLPLDSTPWEELSKNIKGKFKPKIESLDDNLNELSISDDCVNEKDIDKLNDSKTDISQLKEETLKDTKDFIVPKHKKKKKLKTEQKISTIENSDNDVSDKLIKNDDTESPIANTSKFSPVKRLSKSQKRKLKRKLKRMSESSEVSPKKLDAPVQSETKTPLSKKKLEKRKLYEKVRLERRKELGIMMLPRNFENRLLRLRKALKQKNLPPEEIKMIMREKRAQAQDEFRKSHPTQMCFKCRKPGHLVANCPSNEDNKNISICLKCGSTEHKYTHCKMKLLGFPYANCFICKEQGHITRDCPRNEHGIYPKGGKCTLCDSVKHLRKDCPTLEVKKPSVRLYTIDNGTSVDDEVMEVEQPTSKVKSKKPKVVTF